ncbi:MAG: CapA family protein [Bacillota bacterium]|jgi:predicted RNA-binding Zn ribbon-like protein
MLKPVKILFLILLVLMPMMFYACIASDGQQGRAETPQPMPIPAAEIELVAVGDNLIHNTVYKQAAARAGGQGYDFIDAYQNVVPLVKDADVAFINQETPLASAVFALSGYPRFNSPTEVGDAITEMGFDVVSHANNHMFDQGEQGLLATLDYWDQKENVTVIGAYRNDEDLADIRVVEANDIRLAFIACTEMTNGLYLPDESSMRYLLTEDLDVIKQQIVQAKQLADLVIVSAHWGNENTHSPTDRQKSLAQEMAAAGADIILGHHSHTLQPIEYISRENADPTLVIYSLGNFISAQQGAENMIGGILRLQIKKDYQNDSKTSIMAVDFVPTITHYASGMKNITIYPLNEYSQEQAQNHGVRKYDSRFDYAYIQEVVDTVIGDKFLASGY